MDMDADGRFFAGTLFLTTFKTMRKQSFKQIRDLTATPYNNQLLDTVNDHCLRMSVMQGEYRWHYHQHTDELFIVVEGALKIEFKEGEALILYPNEFLTIPSGTVHKTSCTERTVNLTFEKHADDTVFVD
jgi:mannose-6-phosphate isomerase-like protein (cupin superfamily)